MATFYKANDKYSATLSSGYVAGQTVLYVNVVPDNTPTLVCVGKGTTKETIFIVTGSTVNSLTGVSRLKGYTGDLDAQMPVTCLNNEEFINQYSAAVSTPESLTPLLYGVDGGNNDTYVVSLDVAPASYFEGLTIQFKANTANTGAATLNVNSLGAIAIKKNTSDDLATNDIKAGEVVTVIYDGTNFQLQTGIPTTVGRAFAWYLDGTESVRDEAGAKFISPQNLTVKKIWYICASGTATVRVQKGTTDINAGMSVSSTIGSDDTITTPSITAGDVITLDITAASSPVGITVVMECE